MSKITGTLKILIASAGLSFCQSHQTVIGHSPDYHLQFALGGWERSHPFTGAKGWVATVSEDGNSITLRPDITLPACPAVSCSIQPNGDITVQK